MREWGENTATSGIQHSYSFGYGVDDHHLGMSLRLLRCSVLSFTGSIGC